MSENIREEKEKKGRKENKKQIFSIPLAIIIAGFVVAIALVAGKGGDAGSKEAAAVNPPEKEIDQKIDISIKAQDHILGDPGAPIILVEFSDIDCPYCRNFHPTVKQIISDYDGQVSWLYKHFPLDSLHPNARRKAEATECAAKMGGESAFWQTLNDLVAGKEIDSSLRGCLDSGEMRDLVQKNYQEAIKAGGQGTPYSVLIGPNGSTQVVSGAVSYATLAGMIDDLLK